MTTHYLRGPSSIDRWLSCPGSLQLAEGIEQDQSIYAAEGSAAHDAVEAVLLTGLAPQEFTEEETAEIIQTMIDVVTEIRNAAYEVIQEFIEETFEPVNELLWGGTLDYGLIYRKATGEVVIHIVDYKHGAGVPVQAKENRQLGSYASFVLAKFPEPVDEVRLTIVQPRNGGVSHWSTTTDWIHDLEKLVHETKNETHLQTGDHCRWCPAINICPEVDRKTLEVARTEFAPSKMETAELIEVFRSQKAIRARLDSICQELLGRAERGEKLPGLKAVASLGNRQWIADDTEILTRLKAVKITKAKATKPVLLSPTQLEKVFKSDARFRHLVMRKDKGYVLVDESDRREGVTFQTAQEEFATES